MFKKLIPIVMLVLVSACTNMPAGSNTGMSCTCCAKCECAECCKDGQCSCCQSMEGKQCPMKAKKAN